MTKHWLDIVVNMYIIFLDSCAFFESRPHSKSWTLHSFALFAHREIMTACHRFRFAIDTYTQAGFTSVFLSYYAKMDF